MDPVSPSLCPAPFLRSPCRPGFLVGGWPTPTSPNLSAIPSMGGLGISGTSLDHGNPRSGVVTLGCSGLKIGGEH